jgi:ubiquinone/menaquinone biosynthesis C-methylase UbiE
VEENMTPINNTAIVKQQYANANNLNTRISIHDRYSTNTIGFGNWIVSHYRIDNGMKVLELGCGTGDMWKGRDTIINSCSKLVLSDFSEGMVETTKELLCNYDNIEYSVIDIQEIPYGDETFDVVIANMMLYHVPDLERGLAEVRRVLKKNGSFYCATYGEHGIIEYLSKILAAYGVKDNLNKNFTLQNGYEILSRFFLKVEKLEYIDSLAVTCVDDMVDYIYSLSSMNSLRSTAKKEIKQILIQNTVNGVLNVPKEYGMFIAS